MGEVKLLDCTLRDGGYLNDWHFGADAMRGIAQGLAASGVDIVELGFLDAARGADVERSIQPNMGAMNLAFAGADTGEAMTVAMIDYGTVPLMDIAPRAASLVDGIRVIFKKDRMREALAFCEELERLGYATFAQAVSITAYTEEDLRALCREANRVRPFALSIVDTYGLLGPEALLRIFSTVDECLAPDILLGFHAHNNRQLALANCMAVAAARGERDMVLDATLFGMGKSAGNAPIELLAAHLNEYGGKRYDISRLIDTAQRYILPLHGESAWGYSLPFAIAALCGCHPDYVTALAKEGHSARAVYETLSRLPREARLSFDEKFLKEVYTRC